MRHWLLGESAGQDVYISHAADFGTRKREFSTSFRRAKVLRLKLKQAHHTHYRALVTSPRTCRAGDDGKACQDAIETAKHHGFEVVSLFIVRFIMGLTCAGIVKEPGANGGGRRNKLVTEHQGGEGMSCTRWGVHRRAFQSTHTRTNPTAYVLCCGFQNSWSR